MRKPVVCALEIDFQTLFLIGRNRVEETEALYVSAITTIAPIRDDNVIEGALQRTTA
jgi:hypothetical protein